MVFKWIADQLLAYFPVLLRQLMVIISDSEIERIEIDTIANGVIPLVHPLEWNFR
jgi:hypothetical protein